MARVFVALLLFSLTAIVCTEAVSAAGPVDVFQYLHAHDVYISPADYAHGKAHTGDVTVLQSAVQDAAGRGVAEKIALLQTYPSLYANSLAAANALRHALDLSGVLVLVSPKGIGVSSDKLSTSEIDSIQRRAVPICLSSTFTACAAFAARQAATQVQSDAGASTRGIIIFWVVVLILFGAVIVFFLRRAARRKKAVLANLQQMTSAANSTLSLADEAVAQIENSGAALSPDVRNEYDQALGLRQRARAEIDRAGNQAGLVQANQDAAQAVLALKSVMEKAGLKSNLTNPLDTAVRRCFYCGREDRAPYTTRAIDDGKGHSMDVDVCHVCVQLLDRGQTPQLATVQMGGTMVPWWAVPNSPWYYSYGGPAWQYWLPFTIGMDYGGWYGGGWNGYGGFGYGGYGGGYFDGDAGSGQFAGDPGSAPVDSSGDFGGWGDQGNWGGDSGGDWGSGGGDFGGGGGDWGGGDAGGGDSGGWS